MIVSNIIKLNYMLYGYMPYVIYEDRNFIHPQLATSNPQRICHMNICHMLYVEAGNSFIHNLSMPEIG